MTIYELIEERRRLATLVAKAADDAKVAREAFMVADGTLSARRCQLNALDTRLGEQIRFETEAAL